MGVVLDVAGALMVGSFLLGWWLELLGKCKLPRYSHWLLLVGVALLLRFNPPDVLALISKAF